ncbi:MAG TPA: thiamine pyrophosphate-dependent enzyme [Dehalococcoidia bacterium]|nr:thiamine pyrophosphate-dependent enzyme [Dehalococcoidia bacterium]
MKRAEALEVLAAHKGDGVSVATMRAIPDWYDFGAAPDLNLDNRGCMGAASALGLGIALARPERKVMVIDGDGSLLMQLGTLASIAGTGAANFYHFVVVNGVYETSGYQPTPAVDRLNFATMALGAGYQSAYEIDDLGVFRERLPSILNEEGPVLVALKVELETQRKEVPEDRPTDPAGYLRARLLG